jgi:hypothetical protein
LASISLKQAPRLEEDGDGELVLPVAVVDGYSSGVTAWYAYADEVQVSTPKDESLSTSRAIEPGGPCSDARSIPAPHENDESVFGDCVGSCCMSENAKGKMKAVEEEGEKGDVGEEKPEESELPRGEDDGASSTSTTLSQQQPITQPPPQPLQLQPTPHMTVEISPARPDRIPHRRRGVIGRTELLKDYAPPTRSVPPILPLARRPPRPPQLELALEETESRALAPPPQAHHHHHQYPPVVPYSWEQVAEAIEVLAYQGVDASVWVDGHGHPPTPSLSSPMASNGISTVEVQVQPTFNPSSSELSAALG